MSINGMLEDLALADVLQFVHLGRRSGTLFLWRDDDRRAEIGFYDGRIVSAWTPGHRRLGDLLIGEGIIDRQELVRALAIQEQEGGERTLGQILIGQEMVTRDDVAKVVREQVQATLLDLVTWRHGNFHFEVDELRPVDDVGLVPGELLKDLDLNTQVLLLEAARIFDEKNRREEGETGDEAAEEEEPLDRRLKMAGFARNPAAAEKPDAGGRRRGRRRAWSGPYLETVRCQVVSDDDELVAALRRELPNELARVVAVRLREAGTRMPGEGISPIVLLDLRRDDLSFDDVAILARTRPSASVVALVATADEMAEAYRAGAVAAVIAADGAVAACCRNLIRLSSHPQPQGTFGFGERGGFSRFRHVVQDVQSGLLSATMALNLMHVISESVERAILFLVQDEELRALGAFGFSSRGEPLAEATHGLKIRPGPRSALRRAIDERHPQSLEFEDAALAGELVELLGRPASGQVVIFPVLGAESTISVIYTDNGPRQEEIQDIKILELATSQVGVAFEDELLRQKLGNQSIGALLDEIRPAQRSTQ